MEEKIINMNQFLGAAQGDQEHMLGKFLYFSLANLLVDKDELSSLCESMGIPYTGSTRLSLGDAFRSATGDIRERVPVTVDGETNIYLAYCRDNKRTAGVFSRELVKETLNRETNRYEKLANISCGKNDGMFRCDNLVLDDAVDVQGCCRKAEELFELYQRCANRKQIETICVNFLRGMEATKLKPLSSKPMRRLRERSAWFKAWVSSGSETSRSGAITTMRRASDMAHTTQYSRHRVERLALCSA